MSTTECQSNINTSWPVRLSSLFCGRSGWSHNRLLLLPPRSLLLLHLPPGCPYVCCPSTYAPATVASNVVDAAAAPAAAAVAAPAPPAAAAPAAPAAAAPAAQDDKDDDDDDDDIIKIKLNCMPSFFPDRRLARLYRSKISPASNWCV